MFAVSDQLQLQEILEDYMYSLSFFWLAEIILFQLGKINKITDYIEQALFVKQALHHAVKRIYTVYCLIFRIYFSPGIKEIVLCKKGTYFIVHPIADYTKCIVFKKFRDIPAVTNC